LDMNYPADNRFDKSYLTTMYRSTLTTTHDSTGFAICLLSDTPGFNEEIATGELPSSPDGSSAAFIEATPAGLAMV
jgi:hypothetical protein